MSQRGTHDGEGRILGLQSEGEALITRLSGKGALTSELADRIRHLCDPASPEPLPERFAALEQLVVEHKVEAAGLGRWFRR